MAEGGFLNKHEVKNVPLFALMHDIGHGPFSHGIEELTQLRGDENENGLVVLEQMKNAVKKSGGDYEFIKKIAADVIYIPKTLEMLTPILATIPLHLFAYYAAVLRGCEIDKPRNLAKSVTVE